MEQTIRIFLADASQDYLDLMRAELEQQPDFTVVGTAKNGAEALELLSARKPDVLVSDLLLPGLDGLSLMRRLKDAEKLPRTLVLSGFVSNHMAQAVSALGVDDYLPKPCEQAELIRRIREVGAPDARRATVRGFDSAIRNALINLGVRPNLDGYSYLAEAVHRTMNDRNALQGITKILYPDLAKYFATTPQCIERAIRTAVQKAWQRTTPQQRSDYFHGLFDSCEEPPSNAPLIGAIAEFVRMEYEKQDAWKTE